MSNPFFKNYGPFLVSDILKLINFKTDYIKKDVELKDIKDLYSSNNSDITFFHSKKYLEIAKNTKASFCITTESLKKELPTSCDPLVVENVLVSVSKITSMFYPDSINDDFDESVIAVSYTHLRAHETS